MPILRMTMAPEAGMDIRQLREAITIKAKKEMVRIRMQARDTIINLDSRPHIGDLTEDGITLSWRYKQYKIT